MGEWYTNPVVWIGAITALVIVGRVVFLIGEWKGNVDNDRRDFKSFMEEIRTELSRIHSRIDDIFGKLGGPATVQTTSPITLTELGQSVSETLGASAWAEERAPRLLKRVADAGAYDIQVFAYQYVEDEFTPDPAMEATIKQCAYENGLRRKQVLDVLAIELRDRLLRLRRGASAPAVARKPGVCRAYDGLDVGMRGRESEQPSRP